MHRDLKPDNIFLSKDEKLKVADYGMSRPLELFMTPDPGTPVFMAPETFSMKYN